MKDGEGNTPLDIRKREHPEDGKGIDLLELVIITIEQENNNSICKIS